MAQLVAICNGTISDETATGHFKNSCDGNWEFIDLQLFMPTSQLSQNTVETMFVAAVVVLLTGASFRYVRRQFNWK